MRRLMPMLILLAMGAAGCATHAPIVEAPLPPDEAPPDFGEAPPDFEDASYEEGLGEAAPGSFLGELAGVLDSTAQVLQGVRDLRGQLRDWDANPGQIVDPSDASLSREPDDGEPAKFSGTAAGGDPLIRTLRAPQGRARHDNREVETKRDMRKAEPKKRDAKKEAKPDPKKFPTKDVEKGKQKEKRPVERDRKAGRKPITRIKPRGNR